jgi:hypothetical protein
MKKTPPPTNQLVNVKVATDDNKSPFSLYVEKVELSPFE